VELGDDAAYAMIGIGTISFKVFLRTFSMCKRCALGKHSEIAFPSSEQRAKEILGLIHFDEHGPMSFSSLKGNLYYVSFIDGYLIDWTIGRRGSLYT
jgi:hypothetical protein